MSSPCRDIMSHVVKTMSSPAFLLRLVFVGMFVTSFSVGTYQAHRVVSSEYYRSCNANMFRTMFIKNSRYCEVMRSLILLMETKFVEVARLLAASVLR